MTSHDVYKKNPLFLKKCLFDINIYVEVKNNDIDTDTTRKIDYA